MITRRRFELIRQRSSRVDGHRTLFFNTAGGSRKRPSKFLRVEDVPEFEGERAWFICERAPGGRWRAVQRVDRFGRAWEEEAEGA